MEYKCSVDDNIYIAKAIFPVNRVRDIVDEIQISKRLATSGSPCIAQFLFAISFADRLFTSKNPGESMSLSVLYYMIEKLMGTSNIKACILINSHFNQREVMPYPKIDISSIPVPVLTILTDNDEKLPIFKLFSFIDKIPLVS